MVDIHKEDMTLHLNGRLDGEQAPALRQALESLEGTWTVDCSGVEYISSASLAELLETQQRLSATGDELKLVGVTRHVRMVLQLTGFDAIFSVS